MAGVVNINDVLDGRVGLTVDCIDRLYLNGYCPILQVGGQAVRFLTEDLGNPIPSPALFTQIGNRFRREADHFAAGDGIPLLYLKKPDRSRWDDRKLDHVQPHLDRAEAAGRFRVVAIVVAQEFQWVTGARNRSPKPGVVSYDFIREQRRVNAYYFYILDRDFGPGSSRSAGISPTQSRCGSTGTSGPNGKPSTRAWPTLRWPTASPAAPIPRRCSRSATGSPRSTSMLFSTGGSQ
jgi:hypothetical protein